MCCGKKKTHDDSEDGPSQWTPELFRQYFRIPNAINAGDRWLSYTLETPAAAYGSERMGAYRRHHRNKTNFYFFFSHSSTLYSLPTASLSLTCHPTLRSANT